VAANLTVHTPIIPLITTSGNTEQTMGIPEKATQTFKLGVVVQLNAGYVQQWDGATYTQGCLGVSLIPASNLASNGLGAPGPFQQIGGNAAIQTYGSVINQPNAVNIALGTPITDGRTLVALANSDTIFEGMVDNSAGAVASDYTPVQSDVLKQFGITIDAGGTMYIDRGKTTVGTNTCVQVTRINPVLGSVVNGLVEFVFTSPQQYP
jgi:hypothetical protein